MIPRTTIAAMSVGCGLSVANIYYAQPLLANMALEFGVSDQRISLVGAMAQVGYAAGMLLFVPLGDRLERRSLILLMVAAVTISLTGMALAPSFGWLVAASLAVGVTTIVPQLLIPFAAGLVDPSERGKAVGTIMSGLLIGILLARTVSGWVGASIGWRAMYGLAALLMIALGLALRFLLPRSQPEPTGISYLGLLRSIGGLLRDERILRESCLLGIGSFAAFSAFWTTLSFHLASPPHWYSSRVAGLFGLVGVVGALAAPVAGRLADRGQPRRTIGLSLVLVLISFGVLDISGSNRLGLAAGVVLLDLGAQACHISNQARIFSIRPEARSRMNTAYMVFYFCGGSLGSYAGSIGWGVAGWRGVCVVGAGCAAIGLAIFGMTGDRKKKSTAEDADGHG